MQKRQPPAPCVQFRLEVRVTLGRYGTAEGSFELADRRFLTPAEAFALLEETIEEVFPDAVAAPYVMMAATDSRTFTAICDRVYRFAPFRMSKAQREAIHSYDEHIGVDTFLEGVRWYQRLLERLG